MVQKASEKIIEALSLLLEGYNELQEAVEAEYGAEQLGEEFEDNPDIHSEIDASIVNEVRAALEAVIDADDVSPEEIASAFSSLTEALEEIDPDVFESDEDEVSEDSMYDDDDDADYYDDDDLDDDLDDLDDDLEEDDEEEEEEEEGEEEENDDEEDY